MRAVTFKWLLTSDPTNEAPGKCGIRLRTAASAEAPGLRVETTRSVGEPGLFEDGFDDPYEVLANADFWSVLHREA